MQRADLLTSLVNSYICIVNIEQLVGYAVSGLERELNVVPAFLKASVSAWDTSLNCVHFSSAILGEQQGQYQEWQREISV